MGDDAPSTDWLYRAFLYRDGKMINLGDEPVVSDLPEEHFPGSHLSQAYAINDKGQVVGRIGDMAALWDRGIAYLLGSVTDISFHPHIAYAINSDGLIVGDADVERLGTRAFLYHRRKLWNLNDLVPATSGWVLRTARGINDKGQIVGSGQHAGKDRGYLLTPIP